MLPYEVIKIRNEFYSLDELEEETAFSRSQDNTEARKKLLHLYETLIEKYSDYYDSHLRKANFLFQENDYTGALQTLESGLSLMQDEALSLARAQVLEKLGEIETARALFMELAQDNPFAAYRLEKLEAHSPAQFENAALYAQGIYFRRARVGELDCTYLQKTITPFTEAVRKEPQSFQIYPYYEEYRGNYMEILPEYLETAYFLWAHLDTHYKRLFHLTEPPENFQAPFRPDALYLRIYSNSDRWYGNPEYIYGHLKTFGPLLEDTLLYLSDEYSEKMDEYRTHKGFLTHHEGRAKDEYNYEKTNYIESRSVGHPELKRFKHYLSMEHLCWKQYQLRNNAHLKLEKKDVPEKMREIQKSLSYDPDNHHAWHQKGLLHQFRGELLRAKECFEKAESLNTNPEQLLSAGILFLNNQEFREAVVTFDKIIQSGLELKMAHLLKGFALIKANNNVGAQLEFGQALDTDSPLPDYRKEMAAGLSGFFSLLLEYFNFCESSRIQSSVLELDYLDWAKFLFKKNKKFDRALKLCERALLLNQENTDTLFLKGRIHLKTGDRVQAGKIFRNVLERLPEHTEAMAKLGDLAEKAGLVDKAAGYFRNYVKTSRQMNTNSYDRQIYAARALNLLNNRATELLNNGRQLKAADLCYDQILELTPSLANQFSTYEGGWVGKSNVKSYQGDHETALEYANKALTVNPKSAYAMSAKGSSLNNLGRFNEALSCYEMAMKLGPNYYHSYYCKACTLTLMGGDRKEIRELLKKTLKLAPDMKENIKREPDFEALRSDKWFIELTG